MAQGSQVKGGSKALGASSNDRNFFTGTRIFERLHPFFGGKFTVIRPLAFVDENIIKRFVREKDCPEFVNPCPTAKISKRREIKQLLKELYKSNRKIKGNIFRSMSHVKTEYLLK